MALTVKQVLALAAKGMTQQEIEEFEALSSPLPAAPVQAAVQEPEVPKLKGFAAKQAAGVPCALCEHNLGDPACCGLSAPKAVRVALDEAKVPRGPARVAGRNKAKELQREAGWGGPAFSKDMITQCVAEANLVLSK